MYRRKLPVAAPPALRLGDQVGLEEQRQTSYLIELLIGGWVLEFTTPQLFFLLHI